MRSDQRQTAMQFSGFIAEGVFAPGDLSVGACEDDLGAGGGHHGEESVTVYDLKRGNERERFASDATCMGSKDIHELQRADADQESAHNTADRSHDVVGGCGVWRAVAKCAEWREGLIIEAPETQR